MAAPPSKPSPSSQPVASSDVKNNDNNNNNNTDKEDTAVSLKDPPAAAVVPTYRSAQESPHCVVARALLNEGRFEDALGSIEQGIEQNNQAVATALTVSDHNDVSFHESMAPFHYLYGTTLLYSIEETAPMMMADPATDNDDDDDNDADDMQIAWENLELARTILERLVRSSEEDQNHQQLEEHQLKLDLAQVHLREGDLHRINGRYPAAVQDYESCLQYRSAVLGPWDRKIADVHYNLGLVHQLLLVAETTGDNNNNNKEEELAQHRLRSLRHYFFCGRIFCGQLALLCRRQDNPEAFLAAAEQAASNLKSTGDGNADDEEEHLLANKLRSLREHVSRLSVPTNEEDALQFQDVVQMLQEIQETMDEARNSEQGVHQVAEMKAQIAAAAAGASQEGEGTTIGFAKASSTTVEAPANVVLAVKKKKKRPPVEDSKMPADPAKRPRSE